jgi:acetylornithine deacetylase/succinyl-diaminopimelate desuccinylase-like protein
MARSDAEIDTYIQERLDHSLSQLARLVASPSISSQNVGMQATAQLVAAMFEDYGFRSQILPTPGYPVVYAEAGGRADRTIICYNHYDVQPPEPLEAWDSPPFEVTRREGKIYGRGIADDKGHIVSRLAALDAVRDENGMFPCRIKFLIEGGEEISSPHLPEFIAAHRELLAADACVWETGGVDYEGRPGLMLGMRGICYVQYNVRIMSRDAHSGSAHLLPNAAWRLVRALSTVQDEDDRVLIPGFYDDVRPISGQELELLRILDLEEEQMRRSYGITQLRRGLTGMEAKKAVYSPTANIAGFSSGYEGEGPKTVIPATAMAKMDFRLVPDQDPEDIVQKLRRHLADHGFEDVEVQYLGGERAAQTPPDDPFVRLTAQIAEDVYGKPPRISPLIGGSGPMYPFREYLQVPIVTLGIGYPETLVHAPNENIRVEDFVLGTRQMARLVQRFARSV